MKNHNFRLIDEGALESHKNMAIDHSLINSISAKDALPTLRLYQWTRPTITVGYFQRVENTVNVDFCKKNNIPIIRRITGGGTILHDNEITYSFTVPYHSSFVPLNIISSFKYIIEPLIITLQSLNIEAVFKPINDILVNNRKISGSAQVRKNGVLQQQGTLIIDLNKDFFVNALKIKDPMTKITTVKKCLNIDLGHDVIGIVKSKLIKNFSSFMNIYFNPEGLTKMEKKDSDYFSKTMFQSNNWNFKK